MEIVDIFIENTSGLSLSFRGRFDPETWTVTVSDHNISIVIAACAYGDALVVSAFIGSEWILIVHNVDGEFSVGPSSPAIEPEQGRMRRWMAHVQSLTVDQRQQIGRFCHALAVAALLGAIAFAHAATLWTLSDIGSEADLIVAFVLTFFAGLYFIKGD